MPGRRLLVYGATGYTGTLVARLATARGLRPILAGRDPAKLARLAAALGLEHRPVGIEVTDRLADALRDVQVVLNVAGPFSATAGPVVDACLATATHYLDVTGEIPVFETLHRRGAEAAGRGVMLMPGVGFIVVPSDCLAAHLAARLPAAHRLTIAVSRATRPSRGSLKTAIGLWSDVVKVRRRGIVVAVPTGALERRFDFGDGPRLGTAASWGDVFTAFHTTGIPNVEVYHEVNPAERAVFRMSRHLGPLFGTDMWKRALTLQADLLPRGPSDRERHASRRVVVAEVEDRAGRRVVARLRTPEAYTCTAMTAVAVAERVLDGEHAPGFRTPAGVYGPSLVLGLPGMALEDVSLGTPVVAAAT